MTSKPPQQPKTQLTQMLTLAVQNLHAKVSFGGVTLKKGARVPELRIFDGETKQPETYSLLGDKYIVGRSSRASDIVVRNPVVSHVHFSLQRDLKNPNLFTLKDENSTNGVYFGKRRLTSFPLRHGDVITLGPPELATGVKITYYNPPPLWVQLLRYSFYGTGGLMGLLAIWIGIEWSKYPVRPIPPSVGKPVVVYARDGQTPISPVREDTHRELKRLSDFSPYLPKAVMASEDSRFLWHFGVDPYGILRAVLINYQDKDIRQGASTLTQQLARSLFPEVGRENTAGRKLREMIVALKLEAFYSKDKLLTLYLNRIYLGVGSYGFEDAAQFYFDKSARNLTLSEAATLVAMLPAPNLYNPVQDYDTAVQLRNRVITRMANLGMITEEEATRARRSRIEISPKAQEALSSALAPYFYSYVFEELRDLLGEEIAKEGNFIVETGLDPNLQKKAETALQDAVNTAGKTYRYSNGALVTLDTRTGEILAMVGGTDYKQSQFNRVTQAKRQPGSTFKVFPYSAALVKGISAGKVYSCAGVFWMGQNYKPCERTGGATDMYGGMAQSENAIALRVAQDAGLGNTVNLAKKMGIESDLEAVPGLVLGQSEVTVLEMTGAYATFANQGVWNRPHAIKRILDGEECKDPDNPQTCRVIYSFEEDKNGHHQAISPGVAQTMTAMLRSVVQNGTGRGASIGLGEAGKTGTTDRAVDLWFIGYIPSRHLVTGIWLGNDDNSPTNGSSGQAAVLWGQYMRKATQ
ncbi:FHA modulated glycosyl transferase/transpeptidase [Gloeothece citriformis PCC 7424]|uniref:FHA modulated glycosyl transferase/transpeptidase n=1 Tax=Gloeothece citriformis (strain PCC 7424) TaxID=65393 RepID=B7KA57_GLOC7|nr:PBP1A family penicillin-binding protein [Gloeothece citriformis]ACK71413.1 FHA modulated glycosyl transferase/transpeptidase [Gloeothece citriformis PCC 7424]